MHFNLVRHTYNINTHTLTIWSCSPTSNYKQKQTQVRGHQNQPVDTLAFNYAIAPRAGLAYFYGNY